MSCLTLSLDAMGGDFGPKVTIPASLRALDLYPNLRLLLVGDPDAIYPFLVKRNHLLFKRLVVIPTKLVINSNDKPSKAIRMSRGTSMRIALELVKSGEAQGCISGGNTGALMGLSKIILKLVQGIERPALTVILPNQKKRQTIILDLGANIECNCSMLVQFAVMGAVLSEQIVGIHNPQVALLNIGEEETKGLNNIHQASEQLRKIPSIRYIGYLEANELLTGIADVLVCDGFIGNVTLKTMEGVIKNFLSILQSSNNFNKLGWFMQRSMKYWIKKLLLDQFSQLHPDQYNGACLVGLYGIVVKSHGAANQNAFISAIKKTVQAVEHQVPDQIASRLMGVLSNNSH